MERKNGWGGEGRELYCTCAEADTSPGEYCSNRGMHVCCFLLLLFAGYQLKKLGSTTCLKKLGTSLFFKLVPRESLDLM